MADRIIVWEEDYSTFMDSWTDQIYCTRRKDGSCSLRRRSSGDEGTISFAGITGIKSPDKFVEALFVLHDAIDESEIADVICNNLDQMDPRFSKSIKSYIEPRAAAAKLGSTSSDDTQEDP